MTEFFDLATHDDVRQLLDISNRHLKFIKKARTKEIRIPGPKVEHAIVASIFASASIEAALNLFILIPVLYIENSKTRKFFGKLARQYKKLNVRAKLQFAKQFFPNDKSTKKLFNAVEGFFTYRNSIIHTSSDYIEPLALPESIDDLPETINFDDLVPSPQLSNAGKGSEDVYHAFSNYALACRFINKLSQYQFLPPST
jgi:hypothetical protein